MTEIQMDISDVIKDPVFIDLVKSNLIELLRSRYSRPEPKPGFRYKRDWYDRMSSEDILNSDFFIKNIESIWIKKSSLNSEYRSIIKYVCDKALHKLLSEKSDKK